MTIFSLAIIMIL